MDSHLDCIVVGYNEMPFARYAELLGHYGQDSEAFRDLKFSFVEIDGKPVNYVDLLNHALREARGPAAQDPSQVYVRSGEIPNLAAAYLSNFVRKKGIKARYINLFQDEKDRFEEWLKEGPACVAITTTFYVLNFPVNEVVQFVRSHNPRTKIVVGGPLVANHLRNLTGDALEVALKDMGADFYVVDPQGEGTLTSLVRCLNEGQAPSTVPNLIFFKDGRLFHTEVAPEANSMDEVDIHWDEFAREEPMGQTIQMRTARSCSFKCAFCNYPTRAGALALASLETVERELESIRAIGGVSNVVFIDDTFNVPLPRFKELCRMMIRKKFNFNWFSYFRCSNSDEQAFDLMAESGCKGVFLGIESGSPAILKNMNKSATIERYAAGIQSLRQRRITTFGSFILGFPGETSETVRETMDFIRVNKPDFYRAQMWYCEPGTPIMREQEKYRISGEGFVWEHATMTSLEAMDHIDRMFLTTKESVWLPQWSFDFWFIPYITGRGVPVEKFRQFVAHADSLMASNIAACSEVEKQRRQKKVLQQIIDLVRDWPLRADTPAQIPALARSDG